MSHVHASRLNHIAGCERVPAKFVLECIALESLLPLRLDHDVSNSKIRHMNSTWDVVQVPRHVAGIRNRVVNEFRSRKRVEITSVGGNSFPIIGPGRRIRIRVLVRRRRHADLVDERNMVS